MTVTMNAPKSELPAYMQTLSDLYGRGEKDGKTFVYLQQPGVRDHWEQPGALALCRLAIDAGTHRIARLYWEIQTGDDTPLDMEKPDHYEYG